MSSHFCKLLDEYLLFNRLYFQQIFLISDVFIIPFVARFSRNFDSISILIYFLKLTRLAVSIE